MDKSQFDILSEIRQTLDSLKAQIAEIENKLADIESVTENISNPEPVNAPVLEDVREPVSEDFTDPIDISIDIDAFDDVPDLTATIEPVASPAGEVSPGPAAVPAHDEEAEVEVAPAAEVEVSADPTVEARPEPASMFVDDDMPEELLSPAESINDRQEKKTRKAVMDVMGTKCAWKTAIPGAPVKNVISAISLNDRVLFINTLFKEDPMAFQDAISAFNSMSSFAEAEAYVQEKHPDWNLNSDLVYRLMMAVRRKLK